MLRLSKLADYSAVIMVAIAQSAPKVQNAKEIAQSVRLAVPTVSKCLKLLNGAGLLSSQMGAKGGYQLAKDASTISVADIVSAVEGQNGLTECSHGSCNLESVCSVKTNMRLISHVIFSALDSVTLVDLMKPQMSVSSVSVQDIIHFKD